MGNLSKTTYVHIRSKGHTAAVNPEYGSAAFAATRWSYPTPRSSAAVAAAIAVALKLVLPVRNRIVVGVIVLGAFGVAYLVTTIALNVPEARVLARRLRLVR